jgi:hypothetical protein
MLTALVIVAAAIWFIVVNRGRVQITLWLVRVVAPMWLVLLVTFGAGMLAGLLLRRSKKQ